MSEETITLETAKRFLPVKLTREELHQKVGQFSRTLQLQREMQARHDTRKDEMKAEVKEMDGRISRESAIIASQHEDREVEVHTLLYANSATVRIVRIDTGEEIDKRAARVEELQRRIPEPEEPDLRDAYAEGLDAAAAGTPPEANPYEDGGVDWQCWLDGYNSLKAEEVGDGDAE